MKKTENSLADKEVRKKREAEIDRDHQMVKGRFNFKEVPGGKLDFSYRKHRGEPIQNYSLVDGTIYTIPYGVAKHLNTNGWYPVHKHFEDEYGKQQVKVGEKRRRFGFQSLEFTDDVELNSSDANIITVENAATF